MSEITAGELVDRLRAGVAHFEAQKPPIGGGLSLTTFGIQVRGLAQVGGVNPADPQDQPLTLSATETVEWAELESSAVNPLIPAVDQVADHLAEARANWIARKRSGPARDMGGRVGANLSQDGAGAAGSNDA